MEVPMEVNELYQFLETVKNNTNSYYNKLSITADLLVEQSVRNVWRKVAFNELVERREAVGSPDEDDRLRACVSVFRDPIDMTVANGPPAQASFEAHIGELVEAHRHFLTAEEDAAAVADTAASMSTSSLDSSWW